MNTPSVTPSTIVPQAEREASERTTIFYDTGGDTVTIYARDPKLVRLLRAEGFKPTNGEQSRFVIPMRCLLLTVVNRNN